MYLGTSPYVYLWNNSDTTEDLTNLSGNYSVTITDNNGCTTTNNSSVGQPSNGLVSLSSTTYNGYEVSCNGGSNGNIITTNIGGLGSLEAVWSNGDTTKSFKFEAGSYSVTMTDSVGSHYLII